MRLLNKICIVTGAASGIGQATARLFAQEGARVVVVDTNVEGGQSTVDLIKDEDGDSFFLETELTDVDACQRIVKETIGRYGSIDVLHNNAGVMRFGNVVDCTEAEWDRIMAINLKSIFLLSKFVVPEMIKVGGGSIINTASIGGIVGVENAIAYSVSKGGMIQFTRSMALDYGPSNIRVNCICPGSVVTPMLHYVWDVEGQAEEKDFDAMRQLYRKGRPLRKIGTPQDIAYAAVYLASDESQYVTGTCLVVDGGVSAM
jgi:NAD(P)-dependent dehydrogenase (short-subunit alcohol dehydrogenase family)